MNTNTLIEACLFDIGRATDAGTLHALRADVGANESLHSDEKEELCAAIDRRFAVLNRLAAPEIKPRWGV